MERALNLPERVRVLILGGGIHGVGVLHDLAARGWRDVLLVEKGKLGIGTSSRSTKLIHGGLRYLRNPRDFSLVAEGLRERRQLLNVAPDLVKPLEFMFPVLKSGGMPAWMIRTGLSLYDWLSGKQRIKPYRSIPMTEANSIFPEVDWDKFRHCFSFWDGQMDDLAVVHRVAASARHLGAMACEGVQAESLKPCRDGWQAQLRLPNGATQEVSALYVVNALGPWANTFLESSRLKPVYQAFNNKGIHLITKSWGQKVGLFMQSAEDSRIFFILPWQGHTLIGTTEDRFDGDPDVVAAEEQEVRYLLDHANRYLKTPLQPRDIETTFAGLRWLPVEQGRTISQVSRSHLIGVHSAPRGSLLTIYGGKYTTYRALAEIIGDRITRNFGEFRPAGTADPKSWVTSHGDLYTTPDIKTRFSQPAAHVAGIY